MTIVAVDNLGTGDLPASLTWNAAALQVPPEPVSALGDRVWNDLNGNGVQDAGEPGIANVAVSLFDADCTNFVANTATDSNGIYGFSDLMPDHSYCVKFDHGSVQQQLQCTDMPGFLGLTASPVNASGATGATDSDADPVTGETANITLIPGDNDTTWDAGFYCPAKIGDRLVNDLNRDGIQDADEPGIAGQTVTLLECQNGVPGSEITTTTTDTDGIYMFGLLPPGEYAVRFTLPDGFVYSPQNIGSDEAIDCDANPATGVADCVTLAPNQNNADVDACGNVPPAAGLGDFVFADNNADGIQDAGEQGIAGVPVTLLTPGNDGSCGTEDDVDVANTVTGADGLYAFNGLAGGSYCIAVDKSQVSCPFGDPVFSPQNADGSTTANDSDVDSAGKSGNIALPEATFDSTWDAGIFCPASLGDRV